MDTTTKDMREAAGMAADSLRSLSGQMRDAAKKADNNEAMMTGLLMSLSLHAIAALMEELASSEQILRTAVEAALVSLESVPGAEHTRAMLKDALTEAS